MANDDGTCPSLASDGMQLNSSSLRPGTVVEVLCEKGYTLRGNSVMTCQANGFWSSSTPKCIDTEAGSDSQLMVIIVCTIASLVSLGVLFFALYMLCANFKREKKVKKHEKQIEQTMKDIRLYQRTSHQDNVGMPAVIQSNYYSVLRGRPSSSSDDSCPSSVTTTPDLSPADTADFVPVFLPFSGETDTDNVEPQQQDRVLIY